MRKTTIGCACALIFLFATAASTEDDNVKLKTVTARSISLQVPETWKQVKTNSKFRVAQLEIPGTEADSGGANLIVYDFGGPTGGIKANIERWVGQFHEKDRNFELLRGIGEQGKYILVDVSGTWKKPDGPPFARKTIDKPGSRVINVILIAKRDDKLDYYFIKLSGPDAFVKGHAAALRTAFGADPESEKPFKLEDAEN